VLECTDRVLRPYSAVSSSISARLLLTHGRSATLGAGAVVSMSRAAQNFLKQHPPPAGQPSPPHTGRRGISHTTWKSAADEEKVALLCRRVLSDTEPYFKMHLPRSIAREQGRACTASKASIFVCDTCHKGFFVGHNIGGKKKEALGDAITGKWYCAACNEPAPLKEVSLVGSIVFCSNGTHACCR